MGCLTIVGGLIVRVFEVVLGFAPLIHHAKGGTASKRSNELSNECASVRNAAQQHITRDRRVPPPKEPI
jgi:hypothetical protein